MKKSRIYQIFMFALVTLAMVACSKDDPFSGATDTEFGELSTRSLLVTVDNAEQTRSNVSDFLVDIYRGEELVDSYKYAEMPEVITLPVGDYTVKVKSHEVEPAAWDKPYYEGAQDFSIESKKITEVETVVCKLANVRVTIIFDAKLKAAMADDAKVTVVVGDDETLEFGKNETRSGYFAYQENSKTLVATFSGIVDGDQQENFRTYTDVAPANHYRITYRYHETVNTELSGGVETGVHVDATVEVVDMNVNVDPGDDPLLSDDKRPQEGDPEQPGDPGQDDPAVPSTSAPVITAEAPIDLNKVNNVDGGSTVKLKVHSYAEGGITEFKVKIDSDKLTPDELENVGLAADLDLVNPGEFGDAISGLGLPCYVGGKTEEIFDISGFMGLLGILGSGNHNFILTVSDANGTTTATLRLKN